MARTEDRPRLGWLASLSDDIAWFMAAASFTSRAKDLKPLIGGSRAGFLASRASRHGQSA